MADVEALRTLRAEGVPSLLAGPPGTGKTSLVEAAFPDLITVVGDGWRKHRRGLAIGIFRTSRRQAAETPQRSELQRRPVVQLTGH
jgi:hypothetical protein